MKMLLASISVECASGSDKQILGEKVALIHFLKLHHPFYRFFKKILATSKNTHAHPSFGPHQTVFNNFLFFRVDLSFEIHFDL